MTLLEYGYEDMAGDWTIYLWNKDIHVVDKKVQVDHPDDVLYLQTAGFRIVEVAEEEPVVAEVVTTEAVVAEPKRRGRPRKNT